MSRRAASILVLALSVLPWACSSSGPGPPLELAEDIVIAPDDVVTRPEAIHREAPEYPQGLGANRVHKIFTKGVVTRQGLLEEIQILNVVEPVLTKSVLDALARWRFKPATINGQPVAAYMTITFSLRAD